MILHYQHMHSNWIPSELKVTTSHTAAETDTAPLNLSHFQMRFEAKTVLKDSLTIIQCTFMHPDTKLSQFCFFSLKKIKKSTSFS